MNTGKENRMRRLFKNGGTLIVPFDHSLDAGPQPGIEDPAKFTELVSKTDADGILVTPWTLQRIVHKLGNLAVILRLNGCRTCLSKNLTQTDFIATVEQAAQFGADMVVVDVFCGIPNETDFLKMLSKVAVESEKWGIPVMAEMVPLSLLKSQYFGIDKKAEKTGRSISEEIKIISRVGAEHGADVIKTYFPGDIAGFKEACRDATVPIVVAGGPGLKGGDKAVLKMAKESMEGGASGICFGRNVWGHTKPQGMIQALSRIVHD